jgi:YYY domain-containing protein
MKIIQSPKKKILNGLCDLLFVGTLLVAATLRLSGSDWGELEHQHPDESFLTSVTYDIAAVGTSQEALGQPPNSGAQQWRAAFPDDFPDCKEWGGYFDTACSPLNPQNRGHSFYVYGTLPIFLVRGCAELFHKLDNLKMFGRQMSALADLGTLVFLYLIVKRIYNRRIALLASLFSAFAVMQIQQSHFYTTDNFAVLFMFLAIYFAVELALGGQHPATSMQKVEAENDEGINNSFINKLMVFIKHRDFWFSLLFGVALGMAVASKLNTAPLAAFLPLAFLIRYWRTRTEQEDGQRTANWPVIAGYIIVGALFSIITFRILQPYAFSGLGLNPQWVANITEQRLQATPNNDIPWNLQWARRSHLYSFENLTVWGLGLPLGILAWTGFFWMGWRMVKGEWRQHILLWSWTAGYFLWQSMQYNPTMRYQLPIYPFLAMMAAWVIFDWAKPSVAGAKRFNWRALLAGSIGILVLAATAAYAYAFSRIYLRPETRIAASNWIYQNVPGPINLQVQNAAGESFQQPLPLSSGATIQSGNPYQVVFVSQNEGVLTSILLGHVADSSASGTQTLSMTLSTVSDPQPEQVLADLAITADFTPTRDSRGDPVRLTLEEPVSIQKGSTYTLKIQTTGGVMSLIGAAVANETDYDYPLPFRIGSYDAFGGIYRGDLNLQVYWEDNAEKLARFKSVLDQTDFIFIPTNHQYAQITRLPERYPLTTEYYRQLIGCPADKDIIWCYRVAEPGMFQGKLGFDLVATFESYPSIGPLVINDQAAEEAFTFYDHPKVLIFGKNGDYDPAIVEAILGNVDINKAINLTPGQADRYKSLMLPEDQLAAQQAGGTWSDLFNREALQNRFPVLGLLLWYLVILALGICTYPLVRATFSGLADHGYPLARIVGLLLWAWLSWMAGSLGLTYSKLVIGIALGVIILIGLWQTWRQRDELKTEIRTRWKYFLMVEILFLTFFLLDLGLRLGNPDLWHPSKGGERPMDFAYFNAILKSTTFPPYDPWFAGGYINYYYYGYVIVGTPVKLLGIVPSIAYNFILPTLYACLAMGAFSIGWNILHGVRKNKTEDVDEKPPSILDSRFIAGISAAAAMVLLGNLGIIRMLNQGFQRAAAPGGVADGGNIIQRIWWSLKGFTMVLAGWRLPFGIGEWYWNPSRIMPANTGDPITEFPLFTFIYSDLHAHMIAFSLTILLIAWVLSVLVSKVQWKNRMDMLLSFFLGGLVIGALKPTNTWDFYTYLILAVVVLTYTVLRYADVDHILPSFPLLYKRMVLAIVAGAGLVALSFMLYQPFSHWFSQAYSQVELWKGGRSNISSYLVQWGVFLFFIASWMIWETRQWLAETPVSALGKLRPYRDLILGMLVIILLVLILQQAWVMSSVQNVPSKGITILWLALPLAVWAAVLLFRPGITDLKRFVLFMVGTSLLLTMMVEIIVLRGDIGRMNTVFKFYLQAWIMLGICAAAAFGWLINELPKWLPGWRTTWQGAAILLVTGAGLVLLLGGADKIRDRMALSAPRTLDSMTYMNHAQYANYGVDMDLSEDYRAIRWLQDTVQGSPVIVEAASAGVQYQWHQRFSIYTGLPDVVGWEWHQVQQRLLDSATVIARGKEVDGFYGTTDLATARDFLSKYNVRYIIVGQLERAKYAPGAPNGPVPLEGPDGLLKFDQYNGVLWNEAYRDGRTVIYEVFNAGEVNP